MKIMRGLMTLTALLLAMLVFLTGCDGGKWEKETTGEATGVAEAETTAGETVTDKLVTNEPATSESTTDEPVTEVPVASEGLDFTSNGDGTCCVSGIGTCTDLDVVIPSVSPEGDTVTSIGIIAFAQCADLTSITIPDSVTSIGNGAFYKCTSLTSIAIPNSVTSIDKEVFSSCTNLASIEVDSNNSIFYAEGNCLIETASNTLIAGCMNSVIPDSVTSIGNWAFNGCTGLTSIIIPDSVTIIGAGAFKACIGLTGIVIPDSVTNIGAFAFAGCINLASLEVDGNNSVFHADGNCIIETASNTLIVGCMNSVIPDSVTSIDGAAFAECSNLTSITIPGSVTSIASSALGRCTALTDITYNGTIDEWNAVSKDSTWDVETPAYTVHCTDGDIPKSES